MGMLNWLVGLLPEKTAPQPDSQSRFVESAGASVADDDDPSWRRLTGNSNRDLNPLTQARAREISAWLWGGNLLANRLIELPLAFMLAEGVTLTCKDPDAQAVVATFWRDPINNMDRRIVQWARELAVFGEQCYPTFVNEVTGKVRLGYLDPALIETVVTDPDNRAQPIGVVTCKDSHGKSRRYRIIVNGPEEELFTVRTREIRGTFLDGDAFYFAVNDLISGTRGRPDLTASADWLDAYDDYLFGELDRARFLRSFVWDVELRGATPDQVAARAKTMVPPAPNSVRVHNESEKWSAVTPGLSAGDTDSTARLMRNHVLGGRTVPEHWYGGGGDVNRATGESMGDPAVKVMSMRQRELKYILEEIGRYVIRQAFLATGRGEPDFGDPDLDPHAVFPEMATRDTTRYAAALQQVVVAVASAVTQQLMSRRAAVRIIASVAGRLGVEFDPEAELAAAEADAQARAQADVFTTPGSEEGAGNVQ